MTVREDKFIVGLTGRKQSGKSTCAKALRMAYGFQEISFATPLKTTLDSLFGWVPEWESQEWKETINSHSMSMTPRELAQTFGTEWGRGMVHDDIWVELARRSITNSKYERIVMTDVRFDNEAKMVRDRGGKVIHISVLHEDLKVDAHASEAGVDHPLIDYYVEAPRGRIDALGALVVDYVRRML